MAGIPADIATAVPTMPNSKVIQEIGVPSKRNNEPKTKAIVPITVQARGTPV